jgi:hypothetical protein
VNARRGETKAPRIAATPVSTSRRPILSPIVFSIHIPGARITTTAILAP